MEPFAAFEAGRVVDAVNGATVYEARKEGDPKGKFAVKVFSLERLVSEEQQDTKAELDPLFKDIGASFTSRVNLQKKAAETSRCFAPILAAGHDQRGAWYVTDFYPRSVQGMLELFAALEAPDLFRVIQSVTDAALHLKKTSGRSHGNLKPSNVFISGTGKPRSSRVVVADPLPGDSREAERYERADLRAIGELIYQLVLKRKTDFAGGWVILPVETSREWTEAFEKKAPQLLALCNKLLDAVSSPGAYTLDQLAAELSALKPGGSPAVVAVPALAVVVLAAGIGVYFWTARGPKKPSGISVTTDPPGAEVIVKPEDPSLPAQTHPSPWQFTLQAGEYTVIAGYADLGTNKVRINVRPGAILTTNMVIAHGGLVVLSDPPNSTFWLNDKVQRTPYSNSVFKPGPVKIQLQHAGYNAAELQGSVLANSVTVLSNSLEQPGKLDAEKIRVSKYNLAAQNAHLAFDNLEYAKAVDEVKQAEKSKPSPSFETSSWSQASQVLSDLKQKLDAKYQGAMAAGQKALASKEYEPALTNAAFALVFKPDDPDARKLGDQAQKAQKESERNYQAAFKAAQEAMRTNGYVTAIALAKQALQEKPASQPAKDLRDKAQQELDLQEQLDKNYQTAMNAARDAMGRKDYEGAIARADEALKQKPDGQAALALKNEAQEALVAIDLRYRAALAAGQEAMRTNGYAAAIAFAIQALNEKPRGPEALALKTQAQNAQKEADQRYQSALAAAQKAMGGKEYELAVTKANDALKERPDSKEAATLRDRAQQLWDAQKEADRRYLAAMNAAREALAGRQYEAAVAKAKEALTEKTDSKEAVALRDDAQQRWDNQLGSERRYKAAMAAAQQASAAKQYETAIAKASEALKENPDSKEAASLKDDAQRLWDGQELASAQTFFDQGDYGNAGKICNKHQGSPSFKQIAAAIPEESKALVAAQQKLDNGNYSFVQQVKQQSYSGKPPFRKLVTDGEQEQQYLGQLASFQQQTNWIAALTQLNAWANQSFIAKPPFVQLRSWAEGQSTQQIAQLNSELKLFRIWFLGEKNDVGIVDPNTRSKASRLGAIGDPQWYLTELDALKGRYQVLGKLTQDLEKTFSNLKDKIKNWE